MTFVPTKGVVLEWARTFRGLSETEAATKLGISVTDLMDFERDKKHPSFTMFESMASKYRLPQATLFLSAPPDAPKGLVDFRSVDGNAAGKHSFDFEVALSNVRTLVFLAERVAKDDEDFVVPKLPTLELSDDPESAGERERRRLNISVSDQFEWKPGETFGRWRSHLERQGVLVFQQKFPIVDGRGFSTYDSPVAPVIVLNKEETTEGAKAFTIWHEYAHLLLRAPGISDLGGSAVEAFCNRFAASFLIPTEALRELLPNWPNEPMEWPDASIDTWARKLKVSRRALAIRLEQMGFAPTGFGQRFNWGAGRKKSQSGGGNYVATRLSELGSCYVRRLLNAYDRDAIDHVQLVEAIGFDRIDDVRKYVARSNELAGVA